TLNNLQASQGGQYQALVLNTAGVVASSNATLTIILPVAITQQPVSQNVRLPDLNSPGPNVSLSVIASSVTPITYQWRYNDANIPGATNSVLTLPNVVPSQTGDYSVVVRDTYSSATSSVARVKIYSNTS